MTIPLTLACALPLAACGSSSPQAPSTNSRYQQLVKFSECMRTHGVPGFPDPSSSGNLLLRSQAGIKPDSPAFQNAQRACRSLMPNGGRPQPLSTDRQQAALKYSACMRAHGLPSFPDPQFRGGGMTLQLRPGQGLDPNSPAFKTAQKACIGLLPKPPSGG